MDEGIEEEAGDYFKTQDVEVLPEVGYSSFLVDGVGPRNR